MSEVRVTVTSVGSTGSVNATNNAAQYWSDKAREWAISDDVVSNEDRSSKYYAGQAKQYKEGAESAVNGFNSIVESATNEFNTLVNGAESDINGLTSDFSNLYDEKSGALQSEYTGYSSDLDSAKDTAILSISTASTTALNDITTAKNTAIDAVQSEGDTQVSRVQSTGFYMRDGKLYYLENGVEKEFKSGSSRPVGEIFSLPATSNYVPNNSVYIGQPSLTYSGVQGTGLDMFHSLYALITGEAPKLNSIPMAEYDTRITMQGFCGDFGVDTESQTFRLPYIPDGMVVDVAGNVPVTGNGYTLGLTNGVGLFASFYNDSNNNVRAVTQIYGKKLPTNPTATTFLGYKAFGVPTLEQLGANPEYSGLIAITANALKKANLKYYIVVSTESIGTEDIAATWENYQASLAQKANVDFANATPDQDFVDRWGLGVPEYNNYTTLTSTQQLTPTENCLLVAISHARAKACACFIYKGTSAVEANQIVGFFQAANSTFNGAFSIWLNKGETYYIDMSTPTNIDCRVFALKGGA